MNLISQISILLLRTPLTRCPGLYYVRDTTAPTLCYAIHLLVCFSNTMISNARCQIQEVVEEIPQSPDQSPRFQVAAGLVPPGCVSDGPQERWFGLERTETRILHPVSTRYSKCKVFGLGANLAASKLHSPSKDPRRDVRKIMTPSGHPKRHLCKSHAPTRDEDIDPCAEKSQEQENGAVEDGFLPGRQPVEAKVQLVSVVPEFDSPPKAPVLFTDRHSVWRGAERNGMRCLVRTWARG